VCRNVFPFEPKEFEAWVSLRALFHLSAVYSQFHRVTSQPSQQ